MGTASPLPSRVAGTLDPAPHGLRVGAGLLTAGFTALVGLVAWGIGAPNGHLLWPLLTAAVLWAGMVLALVLSTAATPGQWALGLATVDPATGRRDGRLALRRGGELVQWRRLRPAEPTVEAALIGDAGLLPPGARHQVLIDLGTRIELDRPWVLGRNPTPPPSHPTATPFLVPDTDRTLSKSHLVLVPAPGGVEVTDLYSMNGVTVTLPDGRLQPVEAGRSVFAPVGATITWGARTMQVLPC